MECWGTSGDRLAGGRGDCKGGEIKCVGGKRVKESQQKKSAASRLSRKPSQGEGEQRRAAGRDAHVTFMFTWIRRGGGGGR